MRSWALNVDYATNLRPKMANLCYCFIEGRRRDHRKFWNRLVMFLRNNLMIRAAPAVEPNHESADSGGAGAEALNVSQQISWTRSHG